MIMLGSFSGSSDNPGYKRVTVIGTAYNAKGSACVSVDNGGMYFLDGLDRWDEKYYGKKVKVTGTLVLVHHEKQSTDSVEVQEWVGTRRILKRPKWSLAE